MQILVTGATGFIGSHLMEVIPSEHKVYTMGRDGIIPQIALDICIHLAWNVRPGYQSNPDNFDWIQYTKSLAYALQELKCKRFVGVGTCAEYMSSPEPLQEDALLGADSLYAIAKTDTFFALQDTSMSVAWGRVFQPYGPRERPERLIPSVITSLLKGVSVETSPGEQVRDFIHVEDVATAIWKVAESSLVGAVNIGTGKPTKVKEVVNSLGTMLSRPELILPYLSGTLDSYYANNEQLRSLGWEPKYALRNGLKSAIEWWSHEISRNLPNRTSACPAKQNVFYPGRG